MTTRARVRRRVPRAESGRSRLARWLFLGVFLASVGCRQPRERLAENREVEPRASAVATASSTVAPTERARVVARHRLGVPLHPAEGAAEVSARLPDGTWVNVVGKSRDGRWLQVVASDGVRGWLTERYLRAEKEAPAPPRVSVWTGLSECLRQLATEAAPREPGVARFMSYNLRWFPDGMPGKRAGDHPTDVEWLACAIAASRVDVVLLQEIKTTPRGRQALGALVTALNRYTGGSFETRLDPCPIETSQHVGLLYDAARTRASHFRAYAELNPHGEPCRDQLRPGFGGFFEFPGGLDLHVVSVHFKSGQKRRDHELRLRSLAGLGGVIAQATRARFDDDIVVGGDLNTMGCRHCSPAISAGAELELFRTRLAAGTPAWSLVASRQSCSEYHGGAGVLLDHFVLSGGLVPNASAIESEVVGYCADVSCRPFAPNRPPAAYRALSDHCPVVLELPDRDDDPDAPRPPGN